MSVVMRTRALLPWLFLLSAGCALTAFLRFWQVPAAALLGFIVAGIVLGVKGTSLTLPPVIFRLGQALLGLLIARWVTPEALALMLADWPLMLLGLSSTLLASVMIALALIRFAKISPRAAAWGCAPGAASAMVAQAAEQNADVRTVTALQYLRILAAILSAALISHWLPQGSSAPFAIEQLTPYPWAWLSTVAIVALGVFSAQYIANGANLVPLILGVFLHSLWPQSVLLPAELALIAFAAIGLQIGLRFDRPTLIAITKRLPIFLLAVFSLTLLCGLFAWLLASLFARDFNSLFFALSPGGLDAMTIMALESGSAVPLVLAMQTLRIILVIFFGAAFVRLVLTLNRRLGA